MEQVMGFFEMGGYATYVWSSYGLTALVMIGLTVASVRGLRERQKLLQQFEAARPARRRRGDQARGSQ